MKKLHLGALIAKILASRIPSIPGGATRERVAMPRGMSKSRSRRTVFHETPRFARKMQKYGSEYRPGKLFKGHRI